MINRGLLLVGASILLATNNASAFQSNPANSAAIRQSSLPLSNSNNNPQNQRTNAFFTTALRQSPSDDSEGYEIRSENGNSSSPRPTTTFGAEAVPVEQRPSNEYLNLIQQPMFGWASQEVGDGGLGLRLAVTYVAFFFLVCYPISGATWVTEGFLLQKITASNVGAMSVLLVLVLRLYSGWGYIGSRLQSKVIEYEETGWYDGDFEQKTDAEKARDLFLYRSNVKPVEERLKKFSLGVGGAWVASCLALNLATSANPIFDQYDPRMLEKLSYDDKVAATVQQQSNGRPTYCENRYYRAVANGGQGCN
mmetsp:Transcript_25856/g.54646  ORF Transcript_25856/g.54646 Transcript_25856/m.54646 type:complete len:308 (+) Transcript_25856:64-987(+)|eukprot:CAMPEP_0183738058 /NCGR_PEP_ID=MMETSP0737-20130205/53684_1 /TAXON_ID=385413 /ORGANISM="Thalassiosira miniscula, Strain CCMP1093" /LENGTH=307 /DNA_ID=CAMNT_0025972505 /DNA_START=35 /DNA_END=958 /DNA_ORIENTATION=+